MVRTLHAWAWVKRFATMQVGRQVKSFWLMYALRKSVSRAVSALIDGRVPGRLKLYALAAILFILSPLNILGDIPLLGIVDDAGLLSLVLVWFGRVSAPYQHTIDI